MIHLRYLQYVLKHKWFVFAECCKKGHPWLGLIHDWSKFRPSEWFAYANHFYGPDAIYYKEGLADHNFELAWLLHLNRSKHHWQFWLSVDRKKNITVREMPLKYADEMLCDWNGAARAKGQGGEYTETWYKRVKDTLILGPSTRMYIEQKIFGRIISEDIQKEEQDA